MEPLALYLNLDRVQIHGQRKTSLLSYLEAFPDRFANVGDRFGFGLSLADASRDSRAFGDVYPVFVLVDGDVEFHSDPFPSAVLQYRLRTGGCPDSTISPEKVTVDRIRRIRAQFG